MNKIMAFVEEMDGTGDHQVKRSKSGSERQRLHVFSHFQDLDVISAYIYMCVCIDYNHGTGSRVRGARGVGKREMGCEED
jgi:hypothetical protein